MEFSVIKTGGKQYKVSPGQSIKIEKLAGDHKEGDKVVFDQVLLSDDGKSTVFGEPTINGAKVTGTIERIARYKKVRVFRYKAKSNRLKMNGHRQHFFKVKIDSLN